MIQATQSGLSVILIHVLNLNKIKILSQSNLSVRLGSVVKVVFYVQQPSNTYLDSSCLPLSWGSHCLKDLLVKKRI